MGLGFLTLEDSIDGVFCPGSDVWSYCVGAYSHTEKHMRGQRIRQKIVTGYHQFSQVAVDRAHQLSVHALSHACAVACIQAKFGYSESANEQSSRVQGGSEPGRRGSRRAMTADQVYAVAVVGERANSGQRGCFVYTCGPHGVPQEYARCGDPERSKGVHQ